jgi:hypothetical protein
MHKKNCLPKSGRSTNLPFPPDVAEQSRGIRQHRCSEATMFSEDGGEGVVLKCSHSEASKTMHATAVKNTTTRDCRELAHVHTEMHSLVEDGHFKQLSHFLLMECKHPFASKMHSIVKSQSHNKLP